MKKRFCAGILTAAMSVLMASTAFAGTWVQDTARPANQNGISNWWYRNDDGSWAANGWYWIDGNGDGWAESYRFDESGWMYAATTVDGYAVDGSGAWTVDGAAAKKQVSAQADVNQTSNSNNSGTTSESFDAAKKNQWVTDAYGKQYYDSKGKPVTGWKKISSKKYYFDESGYALTGYQDDIEGNSYYFNSDGTLAQKTVHDTEYGVYYVVDKEDYFIVDVVDEDDWKEYKKEADKTAVEITNVVTTSGEKDTSKTTTSGSDLTDEEAYEKLIALKKNYPEGKKWTNSNTYQRGYTIGGGCAGFAFIALDTVFGKNAPSTTYDYLDVDELRVGDHIRMYNGSGGEHSVIILTIKDDYVTVCEGNFNSSIHWGRKITMSELEDEFIYRETCYE